MEEPTSVTPPDLQLLLDRVNRAETPEARQRAWDDLVRYQRERGVRAQPENAEPPQV